MTTPDEFLSAPPTPERDQWGRPKLPHPVTGKPQSWTRATTFKDAVKDGYALGIWQQRMVLKGASLRPDIVRDASKLDVKRNAKRLNGLVESAKTAAGVKERADIGTTLHKLTEDVDAGRPVEVPEEHRADVDAYVRCLRTHRIRVLPRMIERMICVPEFDVAGSFDEVVQLSDGTYAIADKKSGDGLIKYAGLETAVQLAVYAHGLNQHGVWNGGMDASGWDDSGLRVRTDVAIVFHMAAGSGACEAYTLDIRAGWEAAQVCAQVRNLRKRNDWFEPYSAPVAWGERFAGVQSRAEASALWREARAVLGEGPELDHLVMIANDVLDKSVEV